MPKKKTEYVVIGMDRAGRRYMLGWKNKRAQSTGVFNLNAYDWYTATSLPVKFAQRTVAKGFASLLGGPGIVHTEVTSLKKGGF